MNKVYVFKAPAFTVIVGPLVSASEEQASFPARGGET